MSFLDRLNVTVRPAAGVPPRPAADVRAALLALNGPDVQYVVRDGAPEGADLVAEWQVMKPAVKVAVVRTQENAIFQIRMRLVPESCEVRSIDHLWEITWVGTDEPRRKQNQSHSQGQIRQKLSGRAHGRAADGTPEKTETYRFDTADLKNSLQTAVLTAGWTWRGLRMGKI